VPDPPFPERISVMLVEDDPADRDLVVSYLADAGLPLAGLTCVTHLADAIRRGRAGRYDVVLLDLSLPDSAPDRTVERFIEGCRDVALVVLTGSSADGPGVHALRVGADDYLVKGELGPAALRRAVRYAIERHALAREREGLIARMTGALHEAKTLRGLLPICAKCKKIRDDRGAWHSLEDYVTQHSEAHFTHGYCPQCGDELLRELDRDMGE
jgi:CheY-like chemotaxis protein